MVSGSWDKPAHLITKEYVAQLVFQLVDKVIGRGIASSAVRQISQATQQHS